MLLNLIYTNTKKQLHKCMRGNIGMFLESSDAATTAALTIRPGAI